MKHLFFASNACKLLIGAAFIASAAPAMAQDYQYQGQYQDGQYQDGQYQGGQYQSQPDYGDDIIVQGRDHGAPDDVQSLSQAVSYADLDLSSDWGRRELRHRISLTARYLCDRLGEDDGPSTFGPSCRDEATRDALDRVGTVEAHWAPRGTGWTAPRYQAPYPASWQSTYP